MEVQKDVLKDRTLFPDRVNSEELEALKLTLAEREGYPKDTNGMFLRDSDEWISMEEALNNCYIAVFHHYKAEGMEKEGIVIMLASSYHIEDFQLWVAEEDDLNDLHAIDQGEAVRG